MDEKEAGNRTFGQVIDRSRLDRLEGEILAFVSDLHEGGYDNMEIARALLAAATVRARREKWIVTDNFYNHMQDVAVRYIANMKQLNRNLAYKGSMWGAS